MNIFAKVAEHWNVTRYNYFLEIASLVLLVILFLKFIFKKRFSNHTNRLFIVAMSTALIDISLDIITSITVEYANNVPNWLNYTLNGFFYAFQVLFPAFMLAYLILLLGPKAYSNKFFFLYLIPLGFFMLMILINPLTHWFYYFEKIDGNNTFIHGPFFLVYYFAVSFYFVLIGIYTIVYHKRLTKRSTLTLLFSLLIIIIGIAAQMLFPNILFTGLCTTIALYLIEDNIANPYDMVDKISGVFNFNALMTYIDENVVSNKKSGYVIALEIDGITPINETMGMITGNSLYKQLGTFFNNLDGEPKVFRLFSSNFVLLFEDDSMSKQAARLIRDRFEEVWSVDQTDFNLTIKIIKFKNNGNLKSCNQFLEYLSALFSEWRKGAVHNILYVDQTTIDSMVRESTISNLLVNSLTTNYHGLSMRYQPIYNVKTRKFDRAEALIRFNDEKLGYISPAEFVPIIEKAGLAKPLDEYVLREVCKFISRHPDMDIVDVNVSGAEFFTNPANKFISIINKNGISPKHICFEITETATTTYPEHVTMFMNTLVEAGAKFAIDDFGTGYSNVSQLLRQPFTIIKLDKTLLNEDEKTRAFLNSINTLFKQYNYPLVIEGVETEKQLKLAQELKIEYVQGFYFSRPLTEEEFDIFIAKQSIINK